MRKLILISLFLLPAVASAQSLFKIPIQFLPDQIAATAIANSYVTTMTTSGEMTLPTTITVTQINADFISVGGTDITSVTGVDEIKVNETLAVQIPAGTWHSVPGGQSFTTSPGGAWLDIYHNGLLLLEGSGNDYVEAPALPKSTQVKFSYAIGSGSILTYVIRK